MTAVYGDPSRVYSCARLPAQASAALMKGVVGPAFGVGTHRRNFAQFILIWSGLGQAYYIEQTVNKLAI